MRIYLLIYILMIWYLIKFFRLFFVFFEIKVEIFKDENLYKIGNLLFVLL